MPTTAGSRILEGFRPICDADVVERDGRGRPRLARQDEHGRVRDGLVDRELRASGRRATRGTRRASPAARRAARRRRSPRAWRRWRSAPTPAARSASRPRSAASSASSRRTARSRATASSPSRARSTRSARSRRTVRDVRAAARRSSPPTTRATRPTSACPSPSRCRSASDLARPAHRRARRRPARAGRRARACARASRQRVELARGLGAARSREVQPRRAAPHGLAAYYLIAPAEASANLARYDGVRYGLRVDAPDVHRDVRGDAPRRLRRRGQAPHHDRHLRALGRLLRRLLRPGAAGAHADPARLRRGLRAASTCCSLPTAPTVAFELGAKLVDDPLAMYVNDVFTLPVEPGGPARPVDPVRPRRRPAGRPPARRAGVLREPLLAAGHALETAIGFDPVPPRARRRSVPREQHPGWLGGRDRPRDPRPARARARRCSAAARTATAASRTRTSARSASRIPGCCRCRTARRSSQAITRRPRARLAGSPSIAQVRPQELLLSRTAQGLPDLAVRPAALRRGVASTCRPTTAARRRALRARAPRGGRGEDDPRRRRAAAASPARRRPSSTSTAAARRCSRS